MERLLNIGFKYAGKWVLHDNELDFELENPSNKINILYTFVINTKVMYIGKSNRTLYDRMYNYKKNELSQSTNYKNSKRIKENILNGKVVEIYAFIDNGLLSYGDFKINLSAGLEDSLINLIQPEWNILK